MSEHTIADTARSFVDGTGVILACSAAVTLCYLQLGDWMLESGRIGAQGHFLGAVIAFITALVIALAAGIIFMERLEGDADES